MVSSNHLPIYTKLELGIKKMSSKLKPFDLEFQPFIDEVNAKEGVIRECADAATMERVRSKCNSIIKLQLSCWVMLYTTADS